MPEVPEEALQAAMRHVVVAKVLHHVECEGPPQAGHDAQAVAIVAALAEAGMVVVPVGDVGAVLDEILGGEGLVVVSVEDLAATIRDADQLSFVVGHDDESDTRLDRLRALLPPELIDDKDGARRG